MAGIRIGNGKLAAPRGALWIGLIGYIATAALGVLAVANAPWTKSTFTVDEWLHSYTSNWQETLAFLLDEIDRPIIVAVILLVGGLAITLWRGWMPAVGFILVAGLGWLLIAGIKQVVAEPRPTTFYPELQEQALSYPSGHVTFVIALTVATGAVLAGSRWRWPLVIALVLLTLLTAWSRLLLGVHYPMDVVGGLLGGFSSSLIVLALWNFFIVRLQSGRKSR